MQDYLPLLAKLPIVIAAMVWAVRELVLLKRDARERERAFGDSGADERGS